MKRLLGRGVSRLPQCFIFGREFSEAKCLMGEASENSDSFKGYLFNTLRCLLSSALNSIPFYQDFYENCGFDIESFRSMKDYELIPVLRKEDLKEYPLSMRSIKPARKSNTGGTSGQPLDFYLDRGAGAREWAHMYDIWGQVGYSRSKLKLVFRGANLGNEPYVYNPLFNEYQVNAYCPNDVLFSALVSLVKKNKISFLHGYPSAIYEFTITAQQECPELVVSLQRSVDAVLLGSEFPLLEYRRLIDQVWRVSLSWYGHSEKAVLAREIDDPYVYHPYQSYGYTEAVDVDGEYALVGTTLFNHNCPLIRYDTGDRITPISYKNSILESFEIASGRVGEFVVDVTHKRIPLTALIFGRHHKIFEIADFVQVFQPRVGAVSILISSSRRIENPEQFFDSGNLNLSVIYERLERPIKTKAGKVPLLVTQSMYATRKTHQL